jgi:3-hydroxyacyl-CoA dehydrogenase
MGKEGGAKAAHVHVVGAGTMGGDIAAWCALRGLNVTLQDQNAERLAPAMGRAAKLFSERLRDPRRVRDASDRLIPDVAGDGVARADVVIEAIFENVDAKRNLFAAVERKAKPSAILATNTSSIPLEEIATAMTDPSRLIGLHFFNPVPKMMLVEIVHGTSTAEALMAPAAAFVRQIDKLPLPVRSAPGFLVNRVLAPYLMEAFRCVDEGIPPETVDEAALAFGMPMGPIELADTVGLDICVAVGKMLAPQAPPPAKLSELVAAGHLGRKAKRGFYDYATGKPAKNAPGTVPPGLADRLIGPFVAEAKAALAEGIVTDADLVDAGAIFRHGVRAVPRRPAPLRTAKGLGTRVATAGNAILGVKSYSALPRLDAGGFWCSIPPGDGVTGRSRHTRLASSLFGRRLVDKIWLKNYPKGVPPEINVNDYASIREVFTESVGRFADRPAYSCMGKTITFRDLDHLSAAFGAYLQMNGCTKGTRVALMMAEHPAVPGVPVRHPAIGVHGRQRQSALHRARARASAGRLGRRGDRRRRELRADRIGSARQDEGAAGDRHEHRRAPRLQGDRRRPRAATCQEDDSVLEDSGLGEVGRRARRRARRKARARPARPRRHRIPAVHRRHHGRREGRRAAPPQHHREPAAGARLAAAVHR